MNLLNKLKQPTLLLMVFTILSNIISFLKNIVVAYFFGTNVVLDAYVVAVFIPTLLSGLVMGSLQAVLVPTVISNIKEYGHKYAFLLYKSVSLLVVISMFVVSIIFVLFSESILSFLPLGFKNSNHELIVSLSNILIFMLVFNALNILMKNLYYIKNQFLIPALSNLIGAFFSIGFIIIVNNPSIYTIGYSLYVGIIVDTLFLLLLFKKTNVIIPKGFVFWNKDIKQTLLLLIPLTISASLGHANPFIDQIMASNLFEGAVSALNYADKLNNMLIQIFVLTLSTVVLSKFSIQIANNQIEQLKISFNKIIKTYFAVLFPIIVLVFILRYEVVYFLFNRGEFSERSTNLTSNAWIVYTSGIYFVLIGTVCARVLNALKDAKIQTVIALLGLFINVLGNIYFMKIWGYLGIALSTSLSSLITTLLLIIYLNAKIGKIFNKDTLISLVKICISNTLVIFILNMVKNSISLNYYSKFHIYIYICGIALLGAVLIIGLYWLFGLIRLLPVMNRGVRVNEEQEG